MNPKWTQYLEENAPDRGAAKAECAFSALDEGLIRVTGEDARDFLQGQLTNDIRRLTPEQAQLNGYCTPKGRMLALFLVFERDGALYLQLPRERLEPVMKRLQMFVLRSKVERVSDDFWPLQNIRAGLPSVHDATTEAFVPQMCNLDLLGGVSFTKGCYTGQEVVARMRYLGQLKRRMYLARIGTGTCPAPGDALFSPSSRSAQGAGRVVAARPSPEGGCEALVVAEIAAFEAADLRLGDENGPPLELREPPYGLTSVEE